MKAELENKQFNLMKKLKENYHDIINFKLKGVQLLQGWILINDQIVVQNNKRKMVWNWLERTVEEVIDDLQKLLTCLITQLQLSMDEKIPLIIKDLYIVMNSVLIIVLFSC